MRDLETGFRLDDWIYLHLIHSTMNYRQLQHYRYSNILQVTVTHSSVLSLLRPPLVVSWQRIHNSLIVTSNHTLIFFAQPNSFLAIIHNHLRLPSLSILCCNCHLFSLIIAELNSRLSSISQLPEILLYSLGAAPTENTASYIVAKQRARRGPKQKTLLATRLLLLRDVTAYVTRSSVACVRAIT
jgi:hypothetical protein